MCPRGNRWITFGTSLNYKKNYIIFCVLRFMPPYERSFILDSLKWSQVCRMVVEYYCPKVLCPCLGDSDSDEVSSSGDGSPENIAMNRGDASEPSSGQKITKIEVSRHTAVVAHQEINVSILEGNFFFKSLSRKRVCDSSHKWNFHI